MSLSKYYSLTLLSLILVASVVIRLFNLSSFPPSLNWDEVSIGYNAYSLLHTGGDEWGVKLPLIFRAFGDYKLPLYLYTAVFSEYIFGPTAMAVRLPSAVAGAIIVFLSYLLSRKIFFDSRLSLLVSLLVCFSPWTWFLSRVALEANLANLFIILGICLLLYRRYLLSLLFFGLSVWTYNSARIFVPLFLVCYLFIHIKSVYIYFKNHRFTAISYVLVATLLFLPMFAQLFSNTGRARFEWVSLLNQGAVNSIEDSRNNSPLPPYLNRIINNRPVYFVSHAVTNYISHFSPGFLFINGGDNYQFNIPHFGLLYLVNLPFFYLGFLFLSKSILTRPSVIDHQLMVIWLFLAPVPASLTLNAPHTLRASAMALPVIIVTAFGIYRLLFKSSTELIKFLIIPIYFLLLILSLDYYAASRLPQYSAYYSQSWQYGYSQVVDYLKQNYSKYDEILITKKYGEPHEFVLFYWPWDPSRYLSDPHLTRYYRTAWYWVDSFAKFRFVNDWELKQVASALPAGKHYLVISSLESVPAGAKINQVNFLDGSPAFIFTEK